MSDPSTAFQRSYALLCAATIAGYPLISSLPLFLRVDHRITSVPYRAAILLLSMRVIILAVRERRLYGGIFWFPFLIFWSFYLLRLLLDVIYWPVPLRLGGAEYFAYGLGMCMVPTIALLARPTDWALSMARRWTLAAAAIACSIALYLNLSAIASGDMTSVQNMRLFSETLTAISFGNLGVTIVLISLFLLLRSQLPSPAATVGLILLLTLGLLATGLAASRGPVLALLLALPALVLIGFRNRARIRAVLLITAVVGLGFSGAFYIQRTYGFGIVSRIQSALDFEGDESSQHRVQLYQDAWNQFLQRPLLGSSLDERNSTFHPHSPVIESFMATGLVGGTAFCLLLLGGMVAAFRLFRWRAEDAWLPLVFGQYLLHALLSGSLYLSAEMWGLLGVVVTLAFGIQPTKARPLQPVMREGISLPRGAEVPT